MATGLIETRPWGEYVILYEDESCKVKLITVKPWCRLSLQFHNHRSEVWTIISGTGEAIIYGDVHACKRRSVFQIPVRVTHRISCCGYVALKFIEVQLGSYLGEDDIVRLEDDYGRIK